MQIFERQSEALDRIEPVDITGRVEAVRGLTVSVADFAVPLGAGCRLACAGGGLDARVIGFDGRSTLVMPAGAMTGIRRGDLVHCTFAEQTVGVCEGLLGRVLDGLGRCIDGQPAPAAPMPQSLWPQPIAPLSRRRIDTPLPTGVRAIDAMLTVGQGQRMGIVSGSGVGKSVLLGMIARRAVADVTVVALIGERGREVRDFVDQELGSEALKHCVVVASTSDEPPLLRVQAGAVATAVAEYFRDRGANVLLVMDSLTRLASAQRQIGLAAGEPATVRGYTPSVFNLLPQLMERCGRTASGSITGFYTVLAEEGDAGDPLADAVRAVADGHIHLTRTLANRGHWPAIDIVTSVSRVMGEVAAPEHQASAARVRRLVGLYREVEELLNLGVYQSGANPQYDEAIAARDAIDAFLRQGVAEPCDFSQTVASLQKLAAADELQETGTYLDDRPTHTMR